MQCGEAMHVYSRERCDQANVIKNTVLANGCLKLREIVFQPSDTPPPFAHLFATPIDCARVRGR